MQSLLLLALAAAPPADTFPPLDGREPPTSVEELWGDFDPRAEPLEVETLHEWSEDGVDLKVVRFRVGVFKGEVARVAGVYGVPSDRDGRVPGLLQIHGGGQYADHRACVTNAARGYATLSLAWAGRISAPDYRVNPDVVKLFWDGQTDDPRYRETTDWGAVDGYHAPGRNAGNTFVGTRPAAWTLDPVDSPRNTGWFLAAVACRRALTFLEEQTEVDADRLGVYGHSMGGKLTVMTASDPRVRAAAPSCGGISDRGEFGPVYDRAIGDDAHLRRVACPIAFLSPVNDFHGRIGDLPTAIDEIQTDDWRVVCSPHRNHNDAGEYAVATQLWMDDHLRGTFKTPTTPKTTVSLDGGRATLTVRPDRSRPIVSVEVYATRPAAARETRRDIEAAKTRQWYFAKPTQSVGHYTAALPIPPGDGPLWALANVRYALDEPVRAAGYYYAPYKTDEFVLSSLLTVVPPQAVPPPTLSLSPLVEDFTGDWQREWFRDTDGSWAVTTHKLATGLHPPPADGVLSLRVKSPEPNTLVIRLDDHAAEVPLTGGDWESVSLSPNDFRNAAGDPLATWNGVRTLTLGHQERLRPARGSDAKPRTVGGEWSGVTPELDNLRWIAGG